jgi:hypothetical protein
MIGERDRQPDPAAIVRLFSKILRVGLATEPLTPAVDEVVTLLHEVDARARRLFGRALAIREVDAHWRPLSYALLKNIVPDFPLCNKSFNQSYSGNDL